NADKKCECPVGRRAQGWKGIVQGREWRDWRAVQLQLEIREWSWFESGGALGSSRSCVLQHGAVRLIGEEWYAAYIGRERGGMYGWAGCWRWVQDFNDTCRNASGRGGNRRCEISGNRSGDV